MVLSVGEVNKNKNHKVGIEALAKLKDRNIYYVICGRGPLVEAHMELARKLGIGDQVIFAGYRIDVADFYQMADVFLFPSLREGLPVAVMEAMASGLPCIVSKIRGNTDLVDEKGGIYFQPSERESVEAAIIQIFSRFAWKMDVSNREKIQGFGIEKVIASMQQIYFDE